MRSLKTILIGLFLIGATVPIHAKRVGNLFDVEIKNKEINITSNVMTYYFANIVSLDGKKVSTPILIGRNDKKLKVDVGKLDLKWKGIVPTISYASPTKVFDFYEKKTNIEYPQNFYKNWENSILQFQGGNLRNFFDVSFHEDKTRAISLLLLNLTVLPQLVADSVAFDSKSTKWTKEKIDKLLDLSNKLKDYQSFVNEVNFYYTIVDSVFDLLTTTVEAYTQEGIPIPEVLSETKAYWKYIKTLIEQTIGSVNALNVDKSVQIDLEKATSEEINKVLKDYDDGLITSEKRADAMIKAIVKSSTEIKDDKAKLTKIINVLLAGIERGLVAYEKGILSAMPQNTKEEKEKYNKKANRIRYAKLAVAVMAFTTKAFTSDIKDDSSFLLKFLSDVGGEVWGLIVDNYINNPMKFINKYSNKVSSGFYSSFSKGVAKIGRGFQIGSTAGNKLIPFLVDFIWEDNFVSINITNGKPSMYGALEKRIKVYSVSYNFTPNETKMERKLIFDSSSMQSEKNYPIYLNSVSDTKDPYEYEVEVYMKQDHLFDDPERTPWKIHSPFPAQNIFSIYIGNEKTQYLNTGFCAKKPPFTPLELAQFAIYEFNDEKGKRLTQCIDDEGFKYPHPVGGPPYEFVEAVDLDKAGAIRYKLKSLDTPVVSKFFRFYSVPSNPRDNYPNKNTMLSYGNTNNISIRLHGYEYSSFFTKLIVNTNLPLNIFIDSITKEDKDILSVSEFELQNDDTVEKYIWSFSNSSDQIETDKPTIERAMSKRNYTAYVEMHTKNGNIIYRKGNIVREKQPIIEFVEGKFSGDNYSVNDTISLDASKSIGGDKIYWYIQNDTTAETVLSSEDYKINYTFTQAGSYTITLFVEDDDGYDSESVQVSITVNESAIVPPTAKAGNDFNVTAGEDIVLDGSNSIQGTYPIDAYSWFENGNMVGADKVITLKNVAAGKHIYRLKTLAHTPNDDQEFTYSEDNITVWVIESANTPPTAKAKATPTTVTQGEAVTFDASQSSDSDGNIVRYEWKEGSIVLSTAVSFTEDNLSAGTHTVTLTVTDDASATDSDSVTVTVNSAAATTRLKKTGQTKSYDHNGNEVTDGSLKDDGYYQAGVDPSYSRDPNTGIVTDPLTGLEWQDDANASTVTKPWLTQENYDKCTGANGQTQSDSACFDTSGDTAATYCSTLPLDGGGWRLPTAKELDGIVDYGRYEPAIDPVFQYTAADDYWSSSTYEGYHDYAWYVYFGYGDRYTNSKNDSFYVRCVRPGE